MRKAKDVMPSNPHEGQLWYDPYLQRLMIWRGQWVEKSPKKPINPTKG